MSRKRHPQAKRAKTTTGATGQEWWLEQYQFAKTVRCNHGVAHVITLDGVAVHVSDELGSRKVPAGFVILNCTGSPNHDEPVIPCALQALLAYVERPRAEEITLHWPDRGTPPVKASFWRALIELCAARNAPLLIHCIGGHGRTGTALAAILIAYSIPSDDAIAFVRKNHCDRAIETKEQETYLFELDSEINGWRDAATQ